MNSSYVIKKEQCPMCKKLGKDNSEDNLAVYSDNHKFCYSCKYTEFPNKIQSFKYHVNDDGKIDYKLPNLPVDCDILYPDMAMKWIEQYELTREDLYKHNVLWSETMQRLIFPVFGDGQLIAWQGRSFFIDEESQKKYPKWFGRGNLSLVYNILGNNKDNLILCEDIISAIRLSKYSCSMPIYGSHFSRERFEHLKLLGFTTVALFLDPDKRKESFIFSKIGSLVGLNTRTIFADKDPKELSDKELQIILDF